MGATAIGPFAVPHGVLAALLGLVTFFILTNIFRKRTSAPLDRWSNFVLVGAVVVARVVHVAGNWASFSQDPVRMLMFWQGGLEVWSGLAAALVLTLVLLRPWRARLTGILIIALSVSVWLAASTFFKESQSGVRLPEVSLQDAAGTPLDLGQYAKGATVLNIWATWCPPCRRELPALIHEAERAKDVTILLVNQAESPEVVSAYLQEQGLSGEHVVFDRNAELPRQLKLVGVPVTLFFKDGLLQDLHAGEISPEALTAKVDALRR